jgi:hypothetical protein
MRTILTTVSAVALLAAGAGSAAARPADALLAGATPPPRQVDTARAARGPHAAAGRIDAALAQRRHGDDLPAFAPSSPPAPVPIVRVTRITGGGFDWGDAGIGAGLTAALLLGTAGVASVRRSPTITPR